MDPVKESLSIVWRIAVAVSREEHKNGSFVMEKLFRISVADVNDGSSKADVFEVGLEFVGELLGHA